MEGGWGFLSITCSKKQRRVGHTASQTPQNISHAGGCDLPSGQEVALGITAAEPIKS